MGRGGREGYRWRTGLREREIGRKRERRGKEIEGRTRESIRESERKTE